MSQQRADRRVGPTLLASLFAGPAAIAGSYAAAGYTPGFVAAPLASFLTSVMPDVVVRFAITTLGTVAGIEHFGQKLNLLLALGLATVLLGGLSFAGVAIGRRVGSRLASVGLAGASVWAATALLTGSPAEALGAGVGAALVVALAAVAADVDRPTGSVSRGRRRVLGGLAGALGVGAAGYVLGGSSNPPAGPGGAPDVPGASGPDGSGGAETDGASAVEDLFAAAEARSLGIDGLESLVSGEDFYRVDINNVDPDLAAEDWSLSVTGSVETEATYTYDDLTAMGGEHRFVTLRCVSDPVNGTMMDNDLWTGVPVSRLLDDVGVEGEYVMFRAEDGYYEEFPVEALRDSFLAYGKNGGTLPREHGFPVRALVPGHWGEINVKWISEIEILDEPATGYWEERGWHGTGPVNTATKLHAVDRSDGEVRVAGHAYAGTRGIERVEVSTDGGESWSEATLSERLPAGTDVDAEYALDAWRQWTHTYDAPGEEHTVVVRAVDGTGTLQPREEESPYPSGAAGWVSRTLSP